MQALRDGADKREILDRTGQVVAIQDASFQIQRGEIFVVMGLSGSGKSTLVRMLNRLIEPTAGNIRIDGVDITAMSARELVELRRRDIAMVFQSFALMPHLNALENAAFGLGVAGVERQTRLSRARNALDTVGLAAYAHSYPDELSGGMRQRVGLARALALEPTVMLMDEAFSALDPLIRFEMQDELLRIREAHNLTVIFISHDLDEALRIADRLAIMDDGTIVQTGTLQQIVANPANAYIRSFFEKVDLSKVFTVADLARINPDVVIRRGPDEVTTAIEMLKGGDQKFGYVEDQAGRFAGVVELASLELAQRAKAIGIAGAFLSDVPIVLADQTIDDCIGVVAECPFDVPVTDHTGRFLGTVGKAQVLKALDGRVP